MSEAGKKGGKKEPKAVAAKGEAKTEPKPAEQGKKGKGPSAGGGRPGGSAAAKDKRSAATATAVQVLRGAAASVVGRACSVTSTVEWETKTKLAAQRAIAELPSIVQ